MQKGDLIKVKTGPGFENRPLHTRGLSGCEGLLLKTYPNSALMWIILVQGKKHFAWPTDLEKICVSED